MPQPEQRARVTIGEGCFLAGTRIALLDDGSDIAVEDLVPGATVLTVAGEAAIRAVRQVVQRRIDHRSHPQQELVTPVRVRGGAIGAGVPRADLLLPPEALLLFHDVPGGDGAPVLVPVSALVNGTTIVHAPPVAALNWCALELDAHDVVLADGLPVATVRPESASVPGRRERRCARLLLPGAQLVALRARIAGTAEPAVAGAEITSDFIDDELRPLRLFADGGEIAPEAEPGDGDYRFLLPEGTGAVRLVSPPRASPAPRDTRKLGVAVMRVALDGTEIGLEGAELGRGFHPAEGNETTRWRWTDGRAWLVLPHSTAERRLEVKISDWHQQLRR
jgi:hypothetical protein